MQPTNTYAFVAWPDETWRFERAMYDLFRMLSTRVEMNATPEEFERFRSGLSHHGITLREVERIAANEPQPAL